VIQNNRWSPATISQFRAALRQAIEEGVREPDEVKYLLARLKEGSTPRPDNTPRTSARKRRSLPHPEFVRLVRHLVGGRHPDNQLAARLLSHNALLFLRPVEWQSAIVRETDLVVQNAKATNGRSFGHERHRDLTNYGAAGVTDLCDLLDTSKSRAVDAGGFGQLRARLASRIGRACKQIGIKRVALYTSCHVGMANAKSWMSPVEVVASAGHRTTATATSHYAKRRTVGGQGKARSPAQRRGC
jgi:hypothetical protein